MGLGRTVTGPSPAEGCFSRDRGDLLVGVLVLRDGLERPAII